MTAACKRRRNAPGTTYAARWLTEDPRDAFGAGFCVMLAVVPVGNAAEDVSEEDIYSVECRIDDGRIKSWTMQRMTQDGEVDAYTLTGSLCPGRRHGGECKSSTWRQRVRSAMTLKPVRWQTEGTTRAVCQPFTNPVTTKGLNSMSTQAARLTHSTFYKACEAMKTHRERFAKDRPNNRRAAAMLSDLAGFQISEASIAEIKEACGIDWEPARKTPQKPDNHFKDRAIRTLARALRLLYRKLDEEMPSTLQDLCSYFDGKTESADATVSGHRQS